MLLSQSLQLSCLQGYAKEVGLTYFDSTTQLWNFQNGITVSLACVDSDRRDTDVDLTMTTEIQDTAQVNIPIEDIKVTDATSFVSSYNEVLAAEKVADPNGPVGTLTEMPLTRVHAVLEAQVIERSTDSASEGGEMGSGDVELPSGSGSGGGEMGSGDVVSGSGSEGGEMGSGDVDIDSPSGSAATPQSALPFYVRVHSATPDDDIYWSGTDPVPIDVAGTFSPGRIFSDAADVLLNFPAELAGTTLLRLPKYAPHRTKLTFILNTVQTMYVALDPSSLDFQATWGALTQQQGFSQLNENITYSDQSNTSQMQIASKALIPGEKIVMHTQSQDCSECKGAIALIAVHLNNV